MDLFGPAKIYNGVALEGTYFRCINWTIQTLNTDYFLLTCGLYNKSFTIVIYDPNDSSQYYNTMIMIISYAPNLTLALASVFNYDRKWRSKLKCNLQFMIVKLL